MATEQRFETREVKQCGNSAHILLPKRFRGDRYNQRDQNGLIVSGAVIVWALLIVEIHKGSVLFYGSSIGAILLTIALHYTKKRADSTESLKTGGSISE